MSLIVSDVLKDNNQNESTVTKTEDGFGMRLSLEQFNGIYGTHYTEEELNALIQR